MTLSYVVCDPFTSGYVATLPFQNVSFNEPLRDNGTMTCEIKVPTVAVGDQLRKVLLLDAAAIYCLWDMQPIWGGILRDFTGWDPVTKTLSLQVDDWRSWFYTRLFTPDPATNAYRDNHWSYTTPTDQFTIATNLLYYALLDDNYVWTDAPYFRFAGDEVPDQTTGNTIPVPASGVMRTQTSWVSSSFKPVGEAIDDLAHRQNGFDWGITYTRDDATGNITPWVNFWYPERQSKGSSQLFFNWEAGKGGNILGFSPPQSAAQRVSIMWATGDGVPPAQPVTNVKIPGLGNPSQSLDPTYGRTDIIRVFREAVSSYTATDLRTLSSHAQTELKDRSDLLSLVNVTTYLDAPDITTYVVGDRARLRLRDEWMNIDVPAARITEWSVSSQDASTPPRVTLTLDVTDAYGALVQVT